MNFNGIKIEKANFKVSDVFSYEGTVQLWDKNTSIALDFPKDKPEDEYFDILEEKIIEYLNKDLPVYEIGSKKLIKKN